MTKTLYLRTFLHYTHSSSSLDVHYRQTLQKPHATNYTILIITIICWRFEPILHILQFFYHMLYSKLLVHSTFSAFHEVTLYTTMMAESCFACDHVLHEPSHAHVNVC